MTELLTDSPSAVPSVDPDVESRRKFREEHSEERHALAFELNQVRALSHKAGVHVDPRFAIYELTVQQRKPKGVLAHLQTDREIYAQMGS